MSLAAAEATAAARAESDKPSELLATSARLATMAWPEVMLVRPGLQPAAAATAVSSPRLRVALNDLGGVNVAIGQLCGWCGTGGVVGGDVGGGGEGVTGGVCVCDRSFGFGGAIPGSSG